MEKKYYRSNLYLLKLKRATLGTNKLNGNALVTLKDSECFYTIARKAEFSDNFYDAISDETYYLWESTNFDFVKNNLSNLYVVDFKPLCKYTDKVIFASKIDLEHEKSRIVNKLNVFVEDEVLNAILVAKGKMSEELSDETKKAILNELFAISNQYYEYQISLVSGEKPSSKSEDKDPVIVEFLNRIKQIEEKIDIYNNQSKFEAKLTL